MCSFSEAHARGVRRRPSKTAPFVAAVVVALSACGSGADSQTQTSSSSATTVSSTSNPPGVADLAGTALTNDSRFRIGSITKTIVAALVLDSVARGDVSLDDPVAELLPGVVPAQRSMTLRMLLDHTSGIFNVGDEGDVIADIDKLTDPVTGLSLSKLLEAKIVDPLELRRTTVAPDDTSAPEMRGYSAESGNGPPVDLTDDLLAVGNGASGGGHLNCG